MKLVGGHNRSAGSTPEILCCSTIQTRLPALSAHLHQRLTAPGFHERGWHILSDGDESAAHFLCRAITLMQCDDIFALSARVLNAVLY